DEVIDFGRDGPGAARGRSGPLQVDVDAQQRGQGADDGEEVHPRRLLADAPNLRRREAHRAPGVTALAGNVLDSCAQVNQHLALLAPRLVNLDDVAGFEVAVHYRRGAVVQVLESPAYAEQQARRLSFGERAAVLVVHLLPACALDVSHDDVGHASFFHD